jgi:hypothetical protein
MRDNEGITDVVAAYPSVDDRAAIRRLALIHCSHRG